MAYYPILRRHPSATLLTVQLLSLVLYPLMDGSETGRVLFAVVGVLVVALCLWVVKRSPSENWIAWALAIPTAAVTLGYLFLGRADLLVYSSLFEAFLYFYAAGSLISYMLRDHEVSSDELFAAGATFTLLAWAFAYTFFVCQAWYPGSFTGSVNPDAPRTWIELLFLSFTTLSSVGLGDGTPLSVSPRQVLR